MESTPVSLEADYANTLLPTLAPPQAIDLITARLRTARFSNEQLADWLREYVKIEQQYANSLSKLIKKPAISDSQGWGQFLPVWQKVVDGLEENADASEVLGQKLAAEVESPIRAYATSASDWTDMRVLHERLSQVAVSYRDLETRISKLRQKNSSNSKARLAEAAEEMDKVCQEWNRSSKFMYQLFETIEEKRWAFIKDVLTREETLTVDRAQKVVAISERIFNALLSFEPSEETKAFCRGVIDKGPAGYIGNAPSISGEGMVSTGPNAQSANSPDPHASESHRSRSSSLVEPQTSSSPHQSNLKSKMGTILGRGKNTPRKNRLSIFGGKKDREKKDHHDTLHDGHSNGSRFGFSRSSATASPPSSSHHRHDSDDDLASSNASVSSERGGINNSRQPSTNPVPARASTFNGTATGSQSRNLPPAPPVSRRRSSLLMNSEVPSEPISRDNGAHPKTITEEGNNLPTPVQPLQDNGTGDDALNQMASSLRKNPTVSRRGPQRGRRESAQTSQPSTPTSEIANLTLRSGEMAPRQPFAPGSGGFSASNLGSEADTTSIHSHQSRTSSLSGPGSSFQHPILTSSGLSTSTVEFLQVALKHGQVTGTSVTMGEVAFHYQPENPNDTTTNISVRIADPTIPSRISANTVFMYPEASGVSPAGPSLFSLNLPALSSYNSSLPIVGLKYVLNRTASDPRSLPPVIIKPLWRFEPNQASLIIDYGTSTGSPLEVADFLISATVEGANVTSAQSNPEGTFYKDKKRMIFKLGTVNVQPLSSPGAKQQRILCRFHTDSLAHEPSVGGVEARFLISGLSPIVPGSVFIEKLAGGSGGSETDPFSDSTPGSNTPSWTPLNGLKSVVAKRYTAAS